MPQANTDLRITILMTRAGLIAAAAFALIIGVMWGPATSANAAETTVTDATGIQTAFDNATGDDNLITLGDDITADETFPLVVPDGATVTLDLNGNHLTTTAAASSAGITVETESTLIIQDSGMDGVLTATGGTYASGLGGGDSSDGGAIKITDGTVTATGGADGAGIGGGYYGAAGTTTITGGTVTAIGGDLGAGIGGGYYGASSGIITITGGTVTATGGKSAAGIGGGFSGDGAAVSIGAGADVTASSLGGIAVGSGGGGASFGSLSNAGSLTIPAGNSIAVPASATITNSGTIDNAGVIEGSGTLTGTGSIANSGAITQSVTVRDTLSVTGNNYLLTFDANNAKATGTPETMRVDASTLESAEASLPTDQPTLDGHTFTGWYSAPTAGEKWSETTSITDDATLYAQWDINSYTVTFDAQGGSAVAAANVDFGNPVTAPGEPNRDGYTFTGWTTDTAGETPWVFGDPITEDITLYAQWDKDEVVSPPADDGDSGSGDSGDSGGPTGGGTDSDSQNTGSTDALPRTGADVTGWPFAGATLLILAGGALLALRRRRNV